MHVSGFLVADTQLYKRLCPSVGRSVGWSVGWLVRRDDRVKKWENAHFHPCPPVRNWWPCIRPCFSFSSSFPSTFFFSFHFYFHKLIPRFFPRLLFSIILIFIHPFSVYNFPLFSIFVSKNRKLLNLSVCSLAKIQLSRKIIIGKRRVFFIEIPKKRACDMGASEA